MSRLTFWNRLRKAADGDGAKVLGKLAGAVTVISIVGGLLWPVARFVLEFLWQAALFLIHNPGWLIIGLVLAFPAFIIVLILCAIVSAVFDRSSGCYPMFDETRSLRRYQGRTLSPCSGGVVPAFLDGSYCIRIDPDEGCFRHEPCVSLAFDYDGNLAPLPKVAPCPDVLDRNGLIAREYAGPGCMEIDATESCYRPTPC